MKSYTTIHNHKCPKCSSQIKEHKYSRTDKYDRKIVYICSNFDCSHTFTIK